MGMISKIGAMFSAFFGGGRNVIAETAEVFRPNAEAQAGRLNERQIRAMELAAAEVAPLGIWGAFVAGLKMLPRPIMAFGVIGLFIFAMMDPEAFAIRMSALSLVPEPLWWLLGAVVSFYFGAREMEKSRGVSARAMISDLKTWRDATEAERPRDPPAVTEADLGAQPADLEDDANPALDRVRAAMPGG
ncbi:MAG: holin family protein [Thioclava sp.]|nr:holin family protein [Thioclava sp.]MBD3803550.1 holin family protein [Thioclava sp.]